MDFKLKYLKYKNKYHLLKQQKGGAAQYPNFSTLSKEELVAFKRRFEEQIDQVVTDTINANFEKGENNTRSSEYAHLYNQLPNAYIETEANDIIESFGQPDAAEQYRCTPADCNHLNQDIGFKQTLVSFLNHQEKATFLSKLDNKLIDKSRAPPGPGETLGAVQIEPAVRTANQLLNRQESQNAADLWNLIDAYVRHIVTTHDYSRDYYAFTYP